MSTPPMLRQMRHDVWATTQLFERCRALTKEQWQLTAPGTYGSIQETFAHIVRANEGYLNTYGVVPQPFIELTASLDEIASRAPATMRRPRTRRRSTHDARSRSSATTMSRRS